MIVNVDKVIELNPNAMLVKRPELILEWDFEKNNELGLDVYEVSRGLDVKAWWICSKENCGSSYDSKIGWRTGGGNCPYCRGIKVNGTNCLNNTHPDIVKDWNSTLNGDLTPNDVTYGKRDKIWWTCELGHEYDCRIGERINGQGCPYCANYKVLKGFNDMWTRNPELAKKLLNPEDGYRYTEGSNFKVDWKCVDCNKVYKNKKIKVVKNEGLNCSTCSHKIKYPERFMIALLNQLGVEFDHDKPLVWSKNKRYDFYLPEYNLIIETHGGQHYDGGFEWIGGNSLEEEQCNDKYKYEMAMSNGINKYIIINCRRSNFNFIKNNILNSELANLFDLSIVDWNSIDTKLKMNLIQNIADDWIKLSNSRLVAKNNRISLKKVNEYLLKATELGYCGYNRNNDLYLRENMILKLDDNYNILDKYIENDDRLIKEGIDIINLPYSWTKLKKVDNHYWSKEKDYIRNKNRLIKKLEELEQLIIEKLIETQITQIDMHNGNVIKVWNCINDILDFNEGYLPAPLYNAMYGHINSYKGFIWVKTKDYDNNIIKEKINNIKNNKLNKSKNRPILKISPVSGEIVDTLYGLPNASKSVGISESSINKCLKRERLTSGGFIWIREEDYNTKEGLEYVKTIIKNKSNK